MSRNCLSGKAELMDELGKCRKEQTQLKGCVQYVFSFPSKIQEDGWARTQQSQLQHNVSGRTSLKRVCLAPLTCDKTGPAGESPSAAPRSSACFPEGFLESPVSGQFHHSEDFQELRGLRGETSPLPSQ